MKEDCGDIDERIGGGWFVEKKGVKVGEEKGFG